MHGGFLQSRHRLRAREHPGRRGRRWSFLRRLRRRRLRRLPGEHVSRRPGDERRAGQPVRRSSGSGTGCPCPSFISGAPGYVLAWESSQSSPPGGRRRNDHRRPRSGRDVHVRAACGGFIAGIRRARAPVVAAWRGPSRSCLRTRPPSCRRFRRCTPCRRDGRRIQNSNVVDCEGRSRRRSSRKAAIRTVNGDPLDLPSDSRGTGGVRECRRRWSQQTSRG